MDVIIKKDLEILTEENNDEEMSISMEEIDIKADFDYEDEFEPESSELSFQNYQQSNLNTITQPVAVKNEFNIEVSQGYHKLEEDDPNINTPSVSYQEELMQKLCNRDITTNTKNHNIKKNNNKEQMSKAYICEFCNKIIKDHSNYRSHKRIHTGERPYKCSYCSKSFKQSAHLKSHIVTHTGNKQHRCNVCQKSFTQSTHLKKHMQSHNDTKEFACSKCETKYSDERAFNLHSERHKKDYKKVQSFQCLECNKTYSQKSSLNTHLRTHTKVKPVKCDSSNICQKELAPKLYNISQKQKTKKNNQALQQNKTQKTKVYACEFCNKIIKDHRNYRSHMRIHTGERPYNCSYCSKSFKQSAHLNSHIVTHTGNKQHKCNVCPKTFTQSTHLKKHMQSHNDTKEFACSKCETKYSDERAFNLHSEMHSQSFRCPKCNKTFCRESSFKAHLITHSGLKHFECDICARSFYNKKSIGAHLRSHMIPRLACNLSGKTFEQSCGRKVHIMKTHETPTVLKSNECFKKIKKEYRFDVHKKIWHCKMEDKTEDSEILGL